MKKLESVVLPEVTVKFSDTIGLLILKEIYTKGLYPSFIEKMSILIARNPHAMQMASQGRLASHEHDSSQQELATIRQMLEQMQTTQNMLMKQVVDYSDSFDIIGSEVQAMRELTKVLQLSLTETMSAIQESASSTEILDKLNKKSVNLDDVVQQSRTVIQNVDKNIAQAPIVPVVSANPLITPTMPTSSDLDDLDLDMFDQGLSNEEMRELAQEFKG